MILNFVFIFLTLSFIIKDSSSQLWPCTDSEECSSVDSATCTALNLCQCPAGYTFSSDVTRCLAESLYGESCIDNNQCSHMLTGSRCNGVCECAAGFTYIRGRCKQLVNLDGSCKDDIDCYFGYDRESVVCDNSKCKCSDGFYQRSENICRRISMFAGDGCVVQQDCQGDGLECVNLICTPAANDDGGGGGDRRARTPLRDVGIQTSFTQIERKNAATSFDQAIVPVQEKKTAKISTRNFGDQCNLQNEPCPELPHSVCVQGRCLCQKGYYPRNNLCVAEIGEVTETAELCGAEAYNTVTKRCVCDRNRFSMDNLRDCIKPSNGIDTACTEPSQCTPFGAAVCPGLEVFPRRCQCHAYADYDAKQELCVPKKGLGSYCEPQDECESRAANTICSPAAKQCVCKENFVDTNGQCRPGQGAKCAVESDCIVSNSQCLPDDQYCKCKNGFQYAKGSCLKEATELNEECKEDEQCQPLLGDMGKCIDAKCTCENHVQFSNGKCNHKKLLGEKCTKAAECYVAVEPENVECRNGVCQCQFGTKKDEEKLVCKSVAKKNSSDRPSALKVITLLLTTAAILVTSAAIKEAYFQ